MTDDMSHQRWQRCKCVEIMTSLTISWLGRTVSWDGTRSSKKSSPSSSRCTSFTVTVFTGALFDERNVWLANTYKRNEFDIQTSWQRWSRISETVIPSPLGLKVRIHRDSRPLKTTAICTPSFFDFESDWSPNVISATTESSAFRSCNVFFAVLLLIHVFFAMTRTWGILTYLPIKSLTFPTRRWPWSNLN